MGTIPRILDFVAGRRGFATELVLAYWRTDRRFEEDKLRMFACGRFATRFGFEIEAETVRANSASFGRNGQMPRPFAMS